MWARRIDALLGDGRSSRDPPRHEVEKIGRGKKGRRGPRGQTRHAGREAEREDVCLCVCSEKGGGAGRGRRDPRGLEEGRVEVGGREERRRVSKRVRYFNFLWKERKNERKERKKKRLVKNVSSKWYWIATGDTFSCEKETLVCPRPIDGLSRQVPSSVPPLTFHPSIHGWIHRSISLMTRSTCAVIPGRPRRCVLDRRARARAASNQKGCPTQPTHRRTVKRGRQCCTAYIGWVCGIHRSMDQCISPTATAGSLITPVPPPSPLWVPDQVAHGCFSLSPPPLSLTVPLSLFLVLFSSLRTPSKKNPDDWMRMAGFPSGKTSAAIP